MIARKTIRWLFLVGANAVALCVLLWAFVEIRYVLQQWRGEYRTPLHTAVSKEDVEAVRVLVEDHPEYVNSLDWKSGTPLWLAAGTGNTAIAKVLITGGADVNVWCPLAVAAGHGDLEMITVLLDHGADPDGAASRDVIPVIEASQHDQLAALRLLLALGANVNTHIDHNGESALGRACYEGRKGVVDFLIQQGAEVNYREDGDRTALHWAAVAGQVECVRILLESGAERVVRDVDGMTASDLARKFGYVKVAEEIDKKRDG